MASFLTTFVLHGLLVSAPILSISMTELGFPTTDEFIQKLKTEITTSMEIVAKNIVPAVSFALIIRKITS
ncbi:hypothetical protein BCD67_24870 [Oscillatoriales cyanobacterium USR001]|nr:hypothetical protein BCD67_24870 [Oscillatoriales cyanobacterium USR001]